MPTAECVTSAARLHTLFPAQRRQARQHHWLASPGSQLQDKASVRIDENRVRRRRRACHVLPLSTGSCGRKTCHRTPVRACGNNRKSGPSAAMAAKSSPGRTTKSTSEQQAVRTLKPR
jgi:hypothetical protein